MDMATEQTTGKTHKPRVLTRGFGVAITFFFIDILTKLFVVVNSPDLGNRWFRFKLIYNEGIAFSLPVPNWLYLPVALAIFSLFVIALVRAIQRDSKAAPWLLFVVLGALSNLIDRIIHAATVDYLLFFSRSAINLADVMIVIGVLLFLQSQKERPETTSPLPSTPAR